MYMSSTMAPITRPMPAISSGSNMRVNQSIQRASSSSWKPAMRSIISPMLPLRSPTTSMRSATGVARPLASSEADTGCPSLMARLAAASGARSTGCSSSAAMPSAPTSGMPPFSSIPVVR